MKRKLIFWVDTEIGPGEAIAKAHDAIASAGFTIEHGVNAHWNGSDQWTGRILNDNDAETVGQFVAGWMGEERLSRLQKQAEEGHANPSQMLKLIEEVRRLGVFDNPKNKSHS